MESMLESYTQDDWLDLISENEENYLRIPEELKTSQSFNLEAIKRSASSIIYIKNQTLEMCELAIKKSPSVFPFVQHQTPKMVWDAIKHNGSNLRYVKSGKTLVLCSLAVSSFGQALEFVPERFKTIELCEKAIKNNWKAIKFSPQTEELCILAIQQNYEAISLILEPSPEVCLTALKKNKNCYSMIKIVENKSYEMTFKNLNDLVNKRLIKTTIKNISN